MPHRSVPRWLVDVCLACDYPRMVADPVPG